MTGASTSRPEIGVLALQGDVREHVRALEAAGARAVPVRRPSEVEAVDALVLPGGESTTMWRLARTFDVLEPLRARIAGGMPAYGSCAGMILLADRVLDGVEGQETFGGLDITVRRNAFGRQVDSFEADVEVDGVPGDAVHAVFIRAPWVEQTGPGVQELARVKGGAADGRIVAVRGGPTQGLVATSFHPELTGDLRVHALFVDVVRQSL
ncbi:5'-phosphate synthase pdxT subunit [Motilibacter peucedani]|uniref:Pyridoxal 5'-phosphate synthase subunit PdxT n=1 Tax=Motilibacter peucedani TaxID=598650 RepID=A0A420XS67_9ACTN|nr:pyridoxal 5'-phosphate synthase glutaminase subunit PdxT [Motilibacter peucedani]RKS77725.1 5'-phosphate synthase pdxT subunit [Motilibacter peucedani]